MIEGEKARVVAWESERGAYLDFAYPREYVMGPWRTKLTLEFSGPFPEWLQKALQENGGYVRILP